MSRSAHGRRKQLRPRRRPDGRPRSHARRPWRAMPVVAPTDVAAAYRAATLRSCLCVSGADCPSQRVRQLPPGADRDVDTGDPVLASHPGGAWGHRDACGGLGSQHAATIKEYDRKGHEHECLAWLLPIRSGYQRRPMAPRSTVEHYCTNNAITISKAIKRITIHSNEAERSDSARSLSIM